MPSFNINKFSANLFKTGVLPNNKYEVLFGLPAGLAGTVVQSDKGQSSFLLLNSDLSYRCINATLPGVILRTSDVNRFGVGVLEKMPFSGSYTDVDFVFLCDRYGLAYNFWYGWLNYIFSVNGEVSPQNQTVRTNAGRSFYTTQYKDSYSTDITIKVYDQTGNQAIQYQLVKAYPISISDTPVSWAATNDTVKLSIKVTFKEWYLLGKNDIPVTVQPPQAVGA
jgi:hypothetical protein